MKKISVSLALTMTLAWASPALARDFSGAWTGTGHLSMLASTPSIENDCDFVLVNIDHLDSNGGFLDLRYQDFRCAEWEVELGDLQLTLQDGNLVQGDHIVGSIGEDGFSYAATRTDGVKMIGSFQVQPDSHLKLDMAELMDERFEDIYSADLHR